MLRSTVRGCTSGREHCWIKLRSTVLLFFDVRARLGPRGRRGGRGAGGDQDSIALGWFRGGLTQNESGRGCW